MSEALNEQPQEVPPILSYEIKDEPLEMIKIFRFRIWRDLETGEYTCDDDVYSHDVPLEMIEAFHKPGEVYSLFAQNETIEADKPVLLVMCDNPKKISDFVSGLNFGRNLDSMFDGR